MINHSLCIILFIIQACFIIAAAAATRARKGWAASVASASWATSSGAAPAATATTAHGAEPAATATTSHGAAPGWNEAPAATAGADVATS